MYRIRWIVALMCATVPLSGQVDQERAATYFKEAAALCEREGGKLWGVSLCGPMVIADPATGTIATNRPAPEGPRPRSLGFANATTQWGGLQWTTFRWQIISSFDEPMRAILMLHELFHRVQAGLGLGATDGQYNHLDTLEGRYWQLLEWRALTKALGTSGAERTAAVRDAMVFRLTRRGLFPGAAENEQRAEIGEGLAHYTAIAASTTSPREAASTAITVVEGFAKGETLVREFGYASGTAYGILLDAYTPGWTRQIKNTEDLGHRLAVAAGIEETGLASSGAAERIAKEYGGVELRAAEEKRDAERKAKVSELRRRFVEGSVLVLPNAGGSFGSAGITPIPPAGTVFPEVHVSAAWGTLTAAQILRPDDYSNITVPAPASVQGQTLRGEGWTLEIAPGWVVLPGKRAGDFQLVRDVSKQ